MRRIVSLEICRSRNNELNRLQTELNEVKVSEESDGKFSDRICLSR